MPHPLIVIAGAPNAGKSTLFNRLLGTRRALVHPMPGMTRDINETECDWDGRRVRLADTGGLLPPGEAGLARDVRARVLAACREADVIVFLVDGRGGLGPLERDLSQIFRQADRPVLLAVNKLDEPSRMDVPPEFSELGFRDVVPLSAEHGIGIGVLREEVLRRLPSIDAPSEAEADPDEIRIAITGRPNVGKSSLLNALLGEERSIVSDVPGTTRDSIDSVLQAGGRRYRIIDTAGIRRQGKVVEKPESLSVMQARRSVEGAQVALLVMDSTEAAAQQDLHVAGIAMERNRPLIVLLNKWDLIGSESDLPRRGSDLTEDRLERVRARIKFAPFAPILAVSAVTGYGVRGILPMVARVHEQSIRRITTGRLNHWLQRAVTTHHPPAARGRDRRFYYAAQKGVNPPSFVLFTSPSEPPHFSYQRYLENSLREAFGLDLTPVVLEYREKPRRPRESRRGRKRPSNTPV